MKILSIGKYRGLQECSTTRNALTILAMDHRVNMRAALDPIHPDKVSDETMLEFKRDIVKYVSPASSAVLLDPEYGIANTIQSGALSGKTGMIATVDESGYKGDQSARRTSLLADWGVAKACLAGADGIKLLVYYHPDAPTAPEIETLVHQVAEECKQHDVAMFLESRAYSLSRSSNKLSPEDRHRVVIETARRLTPLGADVFKAEFPMDIASDVTQAAWSKACSDLSLSSAIPWVLLSGKAGFEIFLRQVTIACEEGASGVAVGRAVWQEAANMEGEARSHYLQNTVHERMERLTSVCNALAKPWTAFYNLPVPNVDWYRRYPQKNAG